MGSYQNGVVAGDRSGTSNGGGGPVPVVDKELDFAQYFCTYAFLYHQKEMLSDRVRMDAYYNSVFQNKHHFKGKVSYLCPPLSMCFCFSFILVCLVSGGLLFWTQNKRLKLFYLLVSWAWFEQVLVWWGWGFFIWETNWKKKAIVFVLLFFSPVFCFLLSMKVEG